MIYTRDDRTLARMQLLERLRENPNFLNDDMFRSFLNARDFDRPADQDESAVRHALVVVISDRRRPKKNIGRWPVDMRERMDVA